MSVRKRTWTTKKGEEKSAWVVDYTDAAGRRRLKSFKLKKAADQFSATATVEVREGVHVADRDTVTVAEAGRLWLASCDAAGLERSTTDQYRQHLDLHIAPHIGAMKLTKLSVPSIRAFQDALRTAGRSPAMVKRVTVSLGGILSDSQERGLVIRIGGDDSESFATLSASLTLLDGGQRYYGVRSARSRRDAAVFEALAARDQTTLQMIESWTQTIVGYREGGLSRETLGRLAKLRKAVVAQQKAGFASASDIAAVDATIAAARQSSAQIKAETEKAASRATRLSGRAPGAKSVLPRLGARLPDKGALVESAHRKNPELQAAASRYHAEIYNSRAAFGRHLPSVELSGRYRKTYEHAAYSSAHDGWTVGVRLNIPLVDLSTVADTAVEIKRKEAALYREAAALRGVEQQIDDLWADWNAARKTAHEADREVAARRKTADAARQRFEKGFGSLNEAVNAESDLYDARRASLRLDAQQTLLAAQLLVVSGNFQPEMLE